MPESVTPIRFRTVFRTLGFIVLGLGLLFGGLHLFLYYRANSLFKAFVEQVSNGQYTANAKKVRFGYLPFRIKATNIHFYAKDSTGVSRLYDVKGDTLQMKLTSIAPILFYNSLEVKEVRLINPRVEVLSDGSNVNASEARFNFSLKEIQEGLLKSLDLLQVDKCEIVDGGFRIVRRDVPKVLAVNHIDLTIDSLLAAKSGMINQSGDTVSVQFLLTVTKPTIEIPDSQYLINVDRLMIDSRKNLFEIDELRFSRDKVAEAYDTIKLSTVSLKGLNWDNFFNNGILELDTIRVRNGIAQIDLTDRLIFQKNLKKERKEQFNVELPLIFHYASVEQVSYQLRSRRKTGVFTMLLDGDSLLIRDFSLLNTTEPALRLGSLSINVRNYQDQDERKTYLAGFDRLYVRNRDLFINNYSLRPIRMEAFSANNYLRVPAIKLSNYNLGELLQGRLDANRLDLQEPTIVIDVLGRDEGKKQGQGGLQGFFTTLNRLQPTLNIDQLGIENARVILQPRSNISDTIVISQLDTEINVERLLSAQSLEDLMLVTEGVRSEGFFITGNKFQFKVTGAVVSPKNNFLGMDRLQGSLESGFELDFDYVQVIGKEGELMIPVDGRLPLSSVNIGSGGMMIEQHKREGERTASSKRAPVLAIDSVIANNLSVTYINKNGGASTMKRLALDIQGLNIDNDNVTWIDALIEGSGLSTGFGDYNLNAGLWYGSLPGTFTLEDVRLWPTQKNLFGATIHLPKLSIANTLAYSGDWLHAVEEVDVFNPRVGWSQIRQTSRDSRSLPGKGILIPQLNIYQPEIEGTRFTRDNEARNIQVNGGIIQVSGLDIFRANPNEVAVSSLLLDLPKPSVGILENWTLQPAKLWLQASRLRWSPGEMPSGFADSLMIQGIGSLPLFRDSLTSLRLNTVRLSGWEYPFATDSILFRLDKTAPWWVEGVDFSSKGEKDSFNVYNLRANNTKREISFDSLKFAPLLERDTFWASQPFQKDHITLSTGSGMLYNWKQSGISLKEGRIEKLRLDDFTLTAARDKRYPVDTVSYRPLLARKLQQLPIELTIDTVEIKDGKIIYQEIGEKWGLEGEFLMDKISGFAYGFTTMENTTKDSLIMDIRARMFGAAPMGLKFAQSYADSLQSFRFDVFLGSWRMAAANDLIAPLNSFEFTRGHSDTMWLQGWGNDQFAYGWTGFGYRKMRMGVLKEGYRRDYFLSGPTNFFTNVILKNNNTGVVTPFYVDRIREKAIFNYWSKMVSGAMTGSMAVPGQKKKARKGMRKQGISAKKE